MLEELKKGKSGGDYSRIMMDTQDLHSQAVSLLSESLKISRNNHHIKIELSFSEKTRMKILDKSKLPVYLRKLDSTKIKEILINISDWEEGDYSIIFTNHSGATIAIGELKI